VRDASDIVTLSLISHTNAGKTTLARTLLRQDVGEVRDAPHVTLFNESHTLLETGGFMLRLWDTPGLRRQCTADEAPAA
jgi:predicted GTPase